MVTFCSYIFFILNSTPYTAFTKDFWKQYLKSGKTSNIIFSEVNKEVYEAWCVLPENEKKVSLFLLYNIKTCISLYDVSM